MRALMFAAYWDSLSHQRLCPKRRRLLLAAFSSWLCFCGMVCGETGTTFLALGKTAAMQGDFLEAEVFLKEASLSASRSVRHMADFWNDYIKVKSHMQDYRFQVIKNTRRETSNINYSIDMLLQRLSVQPFSPEVHLLLSEAYRWHGGSFFVSSVTSTSIYATGMPYAALHEAETAYALAGCGARAFEALLAQRRARETLFLTFRMRFEKCVQCQKCCRTRFKEDSCARCSMDDCCPPGPEWEGMQIQLSKIKAINLALEEERRRLLADGKREMRIKTFFLPMEPLLRDDSFLILAPVAE